MIVVVICTYGQGEIFLVCNLSVAVFMFAIEDASYVFREMSHSVTSYVCKLLKV